MAKTSLKKSTRAKGQLRIDQQAALKKQKALAKTKRKTGGQLTEKEGRALQRAAAKPKAKRKATGGAIGLAQKLRRRFPK